MAALDSFNVWHGLDSANSRPCHEVALTKVEEILGKDPTYNEAVYVKAQILYEGFHERYEALRWLQKILDTASPDETVYQWAVSYIGKIKGGLE